VEVSPAPEPIYPKGKGVEDQTLYVRLGNTTTTLSARQAVAYARDLWGSISCADPISGDRLCNQLFDREASPRLCRGVAIAAAGPALSALSTGGPPDPIEQGRQPMRRFQPVGATPTLSALTRSASTSREPAAG
jgi:hypothetical protein